MKILSKSKAKEYKALALKKERDRNGLFIAEGEKCVKDVLGSFTLEALIGTREWIEKNEQVIKQWDEQLFLADARSIEIISTLASLPQVIGVFRKRKESDAIPVLEKGKLYLLLDEIQDPGNLGTIIRTCDWFGIYHIYASKNTVDVYSPKVVQSTMGSLSRVNVHYVDLEELVSKNRDIKLIGTLLEGTPLENLILSGEGMLLMGNEGRGISDNLKKLIDVAVTIKPENATNHPDSLNVSIATAIIISYIKMKGKF